MIVGNGMLAKLFTEFADTDKVTVFASGVSNSRLNEPAAFERESDLLQKNLHAGACFVYFSTTSVDDPSLDQSPYVLHKRRMEALIREKSPSHLILRLSQVLGDGGNMNTLINSMSYRILNQEPVPIFKSATRNVISTDDVRDIATRFIHSPAYHNQTLNIATPWDVPVSQIIIALEAYWDTPARRELIDGGTPLRTATPEIHDIGYRFTAKSANEYLQQIFAKHLSDRTTFLNRGHL